MGPVVYALKSLGLRHYVAGSVASSFWGKPRLSVDADVVAEVRSPHAKPLCEKLQADYYIDEEMILEAVKLRRSFNVVHLPTSLKVDVYIPPDTDYHQTAFERATEQPLAEDLRSFIASPEDVLLYKLYWYRLGGEVSDRQWSDILGIIEVRGTELDREYVTRWARVLRVDDLLSRIFGEAAR